MKVKSSKKANKKTILAGIAIMATLLTGCGKTKEYDLNQVFIVDRHIDHAVISEEVQEPEYFLAYEEIEKKHICKERDCHASELLEGNYGYKEYDPTYQKFISVENDNEFITYSYHVSEDKKIVLLYTYNSDGEYDNKSMPMSSLGDEIDMDVRPLSFYVENYDGKKYTLEEIKTMYNVIVSGTLENNNSTKKALTME